MSLLLRSSFFLFLSLHCISQNTFNVWYFGGDYYNQNDPGAGIDFSSGSAQPILNTGMGYTEGSATYCDENGNILFYTDGQYIYNRNHMTMPNGDSLGGHWSSEQSALILPVTNQKDLYMIFSNDGFPTGNGTGVFYSILDMSLDNCLGDITSTKAIPLVPNTNEQLIAIKHSNNKDYWVITTERNTSIFYTFLVTDTNVSTPQTTDLGFNDNPMGKIKASPRGDKITIKFSHGGISTHDGDRHILNFDNSTGTISNPVAIHEGATSNGGACFSPDGSLLYDINWNGTNKLLIQYNIDTSDVKASAVEIAIITQPNILAAMQNGPDGRLYIGRQFGDSLSVINAPNLRGVSCDFQLNTIPLGGRIGAISLPNDHFVRDSLTTAINILITNNDDSLLCANEELFELVAPDPGNVSFIWSTGDTSQSIAIETPGTYTVELNGICNYNKTYVIEVAEEDCEEEKKEEEQDIFIPNAISINGDNINESIFISNIGYKNVTFMVYDRFGNLIFESDLANNSMTTWNWLFKEKKVAMGVYTYLLVLREKEDIVKHQIGNIVVLK